MTHANVGLTRRQTLFWLDEQLFPGVPYHHHALTIRLEGPFDEGRFRDAFAATVQAVDQFRLVFELVDREPRQRIDDTVVVPLESVDLASLGESLDAYVARRALEPFDLARGFHRAALVRVATDVHVFCLFMHHVASDGASIALLVNHLRASYEGAPTTYHPPVLAYVAAEHAYRDSKKGARDAAYWSGKLRGGVPPLRFYGSARTGTSVLSHRSWVDVGRARRDALAARAAEAPCHLLNDSVSRLVALATVLFAFVHRVTGNKRLAIGTPVPNRTANFVDTCGLLMEQVFLVVEIDDDETFATLAEKVRQDVFQSFRHAQHCVSDRGLDYVTLNLLTHRFEPFAGLATQVRLQAACTMKDATTSEQGDLRDTFGVQVHDFESGDGLRIGFDCHRETFDDARRARVPGHFLAMFDAFAADLDRSIASVKLVSSEEADALRALGHGDDAGGRAPDLLDVLAARFVTAAERVAVVAPEGTFTYAALHERVVDVASALCALGVQRGSRVGIYLERGVDELTTMLASLWLGAAYVPLDPSHPRDRVRLVLEDAAPEVLVTHRSLDGVLEVGPSTRVLVVDAPRARPERWAPRALDVAPDDRAYILFTSGSTGRPKGVEIPRSAFSNFLRSMAHTPGLHADDRLLAVTTITFDISGLELFLPLMVGASVRIADREASMDPVRLGRIVADEPITVMQATPATFRLLVESGFEGRSSLRILVGGEALSPELGAALVARAGEVWNVYGPTETTVWSTLDRVVDPARIRVGRPIDRTEVAVLDAGLHLVPRGVVGELAIGGDGLALGYRDRDELTRDRFVTLDLGAGPARFYRTGDLARWDEDGKLECLGRIDHQVKIRGFRIELGEIESVLRAVSGVREAVVVARRDAGPDPRLVAYFVDSDPVELSALRDAAKEHLPAYMHPSAYVRLAEFPLNTNGKIDRNALPAPETERVLASADKRPASSDREVRMVALFREVLSVLDVGLDDDFFALGGSSPLALELRRRAAVAFGVELPLRAFFDDATPARLLAKLDEGGQAEAPSDAPLVVRLRRGPDDVPPLFCLVGVQLYDPLARSLAVPRTTYGIHVPVRFSPTRDDPPEVPAIAARYVHAIREVAPHGPYLLLGLCFGGLVAFEVATQLRAAGEVVELVGVVDAVLPGAIRTDRVERLRSVARLAWTQPERIPRFFKRRAERLVHRLPPSQLRTMAVAALGTQPELAGEDVVELPLVGPLVESQFATFERDASFLDAPVVVVRARDVEHVAGQRIAEHGGFEGRARELRVFTLPGDHLGLLQAPNVAALARVFEASLPAPSSSR